MAKRKEEATDLPLAWARALMPIRSGDNLISGAPGPFDEGLPLVRPVQADEQTHAIAHGDAKEEERVLVEWVAHPDWVIALNPHLQES